MSDRAAHLNQTSGRETATRGGIWRHLDLCGRDTSSCDRTRIMDTSPIVVVVRGVQNVEIGVATSGRHSRHTAALTPGIGRASTSPH